LPLDAVLFFDLSMQTIFERVMNRLTCGACGRTFAADQMQGSAARCPACGAPLVRRSDDTPEALEHRIAAYREHTEPLIEYYRKRGIFWTLEAGESPENVFAQITSVLGIIE
jgi:adenylate kinase